MNLSFVSFQILNRILSSFLEQDSWIVCVRFFDNGIILFLEEKKKGIPTRKYAIPWWFPLEITDGSAFRQMAPAWEGPFRRIANTNSSQYIKQDGAFRKPRRIFYEPVWILFTRAVYTFTYLF